MEERRGEGGEERVWAGVGMVCEIAGCDVNTEQSTIWISEWTRLVIFE